VTLAVVVLLAGGISAAVFVFNNGAPVVENQSGDSAYQSSDNDEEPEVSTAEVLPKQHEEFNSQEHNPTSSETTARELDAHISLNQRLGEKQRIRVQINKIVTGKCVLTSGEYSESVEIVQNPQNSSCMGFDIDLSKLGSEFKIVVTADSGESKTLSSAAQ
jgi:hypothetical protein